MADNIVGGLFGIDPAALQQQQQTAMSNRAFNYANLSPAEQGQYGAYIAGGLTGQAAQGLLGIEDPQLKKARIAQQLASEYDVTSSKGLRDYAAALAQSGAPDLAQLAVKRADEMDVSKATVTAKTREQLPTIAKLQAYRDNLIAQVGPNDPRVLEVNAEIKSMGEGKGTKVNVDLGGIASLFAKKEAEASAKDVTERISKAQQALGANSKVSRDISEIEKLLPNTFTGQFSNFNKTASKTLSALGVPVSEKASNTETLTALTNNLVIPAIKQLPGSLAAKELAFLQETKPAALQEPATIKRLVSMVKDDIAVNRALVKRADAYTKQDKLGSLKGFNIELQQDEIYGNVRKYNELKAKVQAGQKISKEEADFAKSVEQELGN